MKKTNNKYYLSSMAVGDVKIFSLDLYDKIRMASHFTGKRHNRKYTTKKTKKTVRVTRIA